MFLDHEESYVSELSAWRSARSIVDVGCGNGYYLSRLAARHPGKTFVGIDLSAELIDRAQQRFTSPRMHFERRDFLRDGAPACDLIMMRFVLQHLPDLGAVLAQAANALRPGGKLLVIDPDFAESSCSPRLPLFMGMFAAFEKWRASLGLLRGGAMGLADRMLAFPGWRVSEERLIRVVQLPPFKDSAAAATFAGWIDLCQRAGGFDYPFADVRAELAAWSDRDDATSSVALRATLLETVDPN
jgi:SAM-dependent methyltransferase